MNDIVTPNSDEIDSTFQQTGDGRYQATHTCENPQVSVDREYYHDDESATLYVYTTYYVDGIEVNVQEQEWDTNTETYRVEHSDEFIVDFCRSNHFADPQLDVEFAQRSHYPSELY
jgi:hypothetical protein